MGKDEKEWKRILREAGRDYNTTKVEEGRVFRYLRTAPTGQKKTIASISPTPTTAPKPTITIFEFECGYLLINDSVENITPIPPKLRRAKNGILPNEGKA